jgi:hypothetical protein
MTLNVPTVTELTLAAQLLVENVCTKFHENLSILILYSRRPDMVFTRKDFVRRVHKILKGEC